jgi:hypothetical protein
MIWIGWMEKHVLIGHITLIQEQRFRLVSENGRGFIFTISRKSAVRLSDLQQVLKSHATIRVEYSGAPNTRSGVADVVRLLAD